MKNIFCSDADSWVSTHRRPPHSDSSVIARRRVEWWLIEWRLLEWRLVDWVMIERWLIEWWLIGWWLIGVVIYWVVIDWVMTDWVVIDWVMIDWMVTARRGRTEPMGQGGARIFPPHPRKTRELASYVLLFIVFVCRFVFERWNTSP